MSRKVTFLGLALAATTLVYAAGCNDATKTDPVQAPRGETPQTAKPGGADKGGDHGHKPGGHGGIIVEIGRDNYHAEAVFEKGGKVRLYLLGKDEAKVQEVEPQTLTAYAKPEGGTEATEVTFNPEPRPDDAAGKTSRFAAALPTELWGARVEVTVPSIRIGGERFRFAFQSAGAAHEDDMPAGVADAEGKKLYLTPSGLYTQADIKANGNVTAQQKYKGFKARHDLKPAPGDKICPVTLTKANPECTWIVGGKTYEFCCPPCIDEFVTLAKETPEVIKEPEAYRKKK